MNEPDIRNANVTAIQEEARHTRSRDPLGPKVAFRSPLSDQMTGEQENRLVDLVMETFKNLDQEMGRSDTHVNSLNNGREWWGERAEQQDTQMRDRLHRTFFGKRMIFEATYQNNLDWRRSMTNSVFKTINLTLSTSRRITNQRIARYTRFFFETRPWWAAQPVGGAEDKQFARKLQKIGDLKMYESGSAEEFRLAISRAAIIGESVLYTQRYVNDEFYMEELEILVDTAGEPVLAHDGDFIQKDDLWVPAATMAPMAVLPGQEGQPGAQVAIADESGKVVLKRDPATERPSLMDWNITVPGMNDIPTTTEGAQFVKQVVNRRAVHYHGAKTSLVNSRDFLCSLTARDIQSADAIFHLDRISVAELAQQYAEDPSEGTVQNAANLLNGSLNGVSQDDPYAPAENQPNVARRETVLNPAPVEGMLDVAHAYIRCDPLNRGMTSDIYVLIDIKRRVPIYYHFTAACSPTRQRPYRVVRTNAVEGRWFGQGEMEQFHNVSLLIDLFLCAAARTQSYSGRVVFFNSAKTIEGELNPKLKFEWGNTYTPLGDANPEEILHVVQIPDNKSVALLEMLQLLNQSATNESGTATANDAQAAGLENQKTATGQNIINNAGNELTSLPVQVLRHGLTQALEDFVGVTYRFHDETETYTIFEGEVPEQFTLARREISNVRVNCQIMLTTYEAERRARQTQESIAIWKDWRMVLAQDPVGAQTVANLYIDGLQANGTENATDYINAAVATPLPPTVGDVKPPAASPGATAVSPFPAQKTPNQAPGDAAAA